MEIIFTNQLDPIFETFCLLFYNTHPEYLTKEAFMEATEDLGVDSDTLYKKTFGLVKKFAAAFQKEVVLTADEEQKLTETNDDLFMILLLAITVNKQWLNEPASLDHETAVRELLMAATAWDGEVDNIRTSEEIFLFIEKEDLTDDLKWLLLQLLHHPVENILSYLGMIRNNIQAYEIAIEKIRIDLDKLLSRYERQNIPGFKLLMKDAGINQPVVKVTPTLSNPLVQLFLYSEKRGSVVYSGLYIEEYFKMIENKKDAKNYFLPILKSLSDSSKFQIMLCLKNQALYNLEIAEKLNLTPATMSHHMNTLVSCGLVSGEKQNGKVYYRVNKEKLAQFFEELRHVLL